MSSDRPNLVNSFRQMFTEDDDSISLPKLAVEIDDVLALLGNERRRVAIVAVSEADGGELELGELSERIAAIENDVEIREVSPKQRKRVYVGMYQCHVSKLTDKGVIGFDRNTLTTTPATEDWAQWVRVLERATGGGVQ